MPYLETKKAESRRRKVSANGHALKRLCHARSIGSGGHPHPLNAAASAECLQLCRERPRPISGSSTENEIDSSERDDDSYVYCQSFPKPVSKKREVNPDYDSYHRYYQKRYRLFAHFDKPSGTASCRRAE
jgi:hypothetical protein